MFRAGKMNLIHRQHLALSEAARWLADALIASPHAIYARKQGTFEPVVVSGLEDAPVFSVAGSVPRALGRACGPMMTTRSHRARVLDALLDPEDRAALRRTDAIALVPLLMDRELEAFLLVGGPLAVFDPERLARALAPVSACLRIARNGAPRPGPEHPLPTAADAPDFALAHH